MFFARRFVAGQQQRVLAVENELAKQKLDVARCDRSSQGQNFVETGQLCTALQTSRMNELGALSIRE